MGVVESGPLLVLLIWYWTVKVEPLASVILCAVGLFRETAILILSVNVVCAVQCEAWPLAVVRKRWAMSD
jgi:hypothetical protein